MSSFPGQTRGTPHFSKSSLKFVIAGALSAPLRQILLEILVLLHLHSIIFLPSLHTSYPPPGLSPSSTFHFASTLSGGLLPERLAIRQSTFYYASTLSQRRKPRGSRTLLYIPLCFYFIPFLFSPLISCSSDLYFVHLLFSLYFHFKNILVKSPKCNFTLTVRALSTYWKFYTISSRQLQKVARFIIIHSPKFFRNPLFISTFKNN